MQDAVVTLRNHINENQVNNVTKRFQEKLKNSSVVKWPIKDVFLRSAVIHKMKSLGYEVDSEGKYVTFTKPKP